ncbi:MFS transporter [Alistipes sp.]|uniref:MFS transporter n=2 Tax=Alistipes TaxID=239759 RepID=UPI0034293C55
MSSATHTDGLPMPRRLGAILAVAFGVGLSVLDATVVGVALPTLSREMGVSSADSIWIVNAYQLATVVALLPLSALGDSLGYRRIYVAGLALFTLASALCALAGTYPLLVAGRVLQGFGAAAVTSVNTTLIRIIYPRAQLGRGMGINATVVAVSSVAGPTVAGALLAVGDWPWLFAVNLPVGVAAFALARRFLPDNPEPCAGRGFRWRDAALNALTFGCLMASVEGFSHGADRRWVAVGLAVAVAVGWRFVRGQLRAERPLLPFDLMRIPLFLVSILTSVCSYFAQMLAMVALPFYFQHECGYDACRTGLLLTAWPAVIVVAAPVAGSLVGRIHAGLLGGAGLAAMAAGLLALALLPDNPATGSIVWRLMLCGVGFALFQSPNNSLLIASAPRHRSGSASGMLATARLVGQTAGAGAMALLFHLAPEAPTRAALLLSCLCAAAGSLTGFSRLSLPLPEALRRRA